MKLRVYVEIDASKSLCETVQRNGFNLQPDGSGMKLTIPNTPIVPKRKTKVRFVENPAHSIDYDVSMNQDEEYLK